MRDLPPVEDELAGAAYAAAGDGAFGEPYGDAADVDVDALVADALGGGHGVIDDDPDARFKRDERKLMRARAAHDGLRGWRERRALVRDAIARLQWGSYTDPETGETVSEEAEIRSQGRIPWVMNRVRPAFRHLKGMFRQSASDVTPFPVDGDNAEATNMIAEACRAVNRENETPILDADGAGEHVMGAFAVRKATEAWDSDADRFRIQDDPVHPSMFFMSRDVADRRLKGLRIIGELHDAAPEDVLAEFGGDPADEAAIRRIYESYGDDDGYRTALEFADETWGFDGVDEVSFTAPRDRSRWRVVEVYEHVGGRRRFYYDPLENKRLSDLDWCAILSKELGYECTPRELAHRVAEENAGRVSEGAPAILEESRYDTWWDVAYLAPTGHVLKEDEVSYWHKSHPYSVSLNELVDGEVFSFLLDILDPQRQINRLFAQIDALINTSAKGLWVVPTQVLAKGQTREQFAAEFTRLGNMMFYDAEKLADYGGTRGAAGAIQQIQGAAVPASIFQFLTLQDQYVEKTTGMTSAVQGQEPSAGTPASLYAQMVQQASTGVVDTIESYREMLRQHEKKKAQLVLQFYDRAVPVRGGPRALGTTTYDPDVVRQFDWDVALGDVAHTATYKMLFEQDLKEFLSAGFLTFRQYLTESSHPRARALLQLVEATNPLAQAGADPAEISAIVEAAAAGDPEAQALLKQAQSAPAPAPAAGAGAPRPSPTPPR